MTYPQAIQYVLDGGSVRRSDWLEDWKLAGTPPLLNGEPYTSDVTDWMSTWEPLSGATILEAIEWVESKLKRRAKLPGKDWWIEEHGGFGLQFRSNDGWWGDNSRPSLDVVKSDKWVLLEAD